MTLDELEAYGMVRMTDEEIDGYLASQSVGVLGLPAERAPGLRPLSFGYDGDALYFLYVLGGESEKERLSRAAETARFLVYSAETPFNWRSVLLTGTLEALSEEGDEYEHARSVMEQAWRPDVFARASATEATAVYRFDVRERVGLKHIGLPPEFDEPVGAESRSE
jgi:nitroimidazol reductase NimA-like FMN-containing flavoprotein (pyridoxamine 5'-phosphate oxidase superfamily)